MITDVPGIRVGNWSDPVAMTGCTVVLAPPGTIGSGVVRGGGPGTRELAILQPGMTAEEVNAVVLSGGSAFGLGVADGVMRWLEERGVGIDAAGWIVPIVPEAVLFDLNLGDSSVRPGPDEGYAACEAAGDDLTEGNVGAGTGATVAKTKGLERCRKGGLGSASARDGDLVVGALAAVNAVGDILDEDGGVLAAPLPGDDDAVTALPGINTTLVVVATNATLSRERANLLAIAASEGMVQSIRPVFTAWDGDTVFTLATGEIEADQSVIEELSIRVTADAIRRGVRAATGVPGAPAAGDEA
ncbi:MAG: P1 family peptidase [Actinomycetota bacterium]